MAKHRYVVGADIGGSHICTDIVDLERGSLVGDSVTIPVDSNSGATEILDAWAEGIRQAIHQTGVTINGVGLAIPGPFDYTRGISLINGVNKFDRIYGLDITASLRDRLRDVNIDSFRFVNDASAFALGECLGGTVRDVHRVVVLTLGTGVGSGFVCDHQLVETGPEVPPNGWVYCLPFEEGIVDDLFSTRWVCARYQELTGSKVDGVREVAERCPHEAEAMQIFSEYGQRLAKFAGPLLDRFHSQTLMLGGNISRAYPYFQFAMQQQFCKDGRQIEIHTSQLLDKAALIGAASLFI